MLRKPAAVYSLKRVLSHPLSSTCPKNQTEEGLLVSGDMTLKVHVPKYYILWPQSTYIGTTSMPKYILFGYMDP